VSFGFLSDPDSNNWGNDVYLTYVLLRATGRYLAPAAGDSTCAPSRHIAKDQIISVFGAVPLVRVKLATLEAFFQQQPHFCDHNSLSCSIPLS